MPEFSSETALCAAFAAAARATGWTVYPETEFDLLLVRRGVQVGVEAKLSATPYALLQALPPLTSMPVRRRGRLARAGFPGPHYRAVLVGGFAGRTRAAREGRRASLYALAAYVGVVVLEPRPGPGGRVEWLHVGWRENLARDVRRPTFPRRRVLDVRAYRWFPSRTIWTPPFVPDRPAGVPSPSTIGPWQLAAVALDLLALDRGWVSIVDAREVSRRFEGRWKPATLLARYFRSTGEPVEPGSRAGRWVANRVRRPRDEWPDVAGYLRAHPGLEPDDGDGAKRPEER